MSQTISNTGEFKNCEICGSQFERMTNISKAAWDKRRFCSRGCFGKHQGERQRTLPDRKCDACGVEYRPHHFGSKYCTPECAKDRFVERHGVKHQSWKGGRHTHVSGYQMVYVPREHPLASVLPLRADRYILEHRLVMAEHMGRPLTRSETVHHINGDRSDNRIENLQLRSGRHGRGQKHVCADCGSTNIKATKI